MYFRKFKIHLEKTISKKFIFLSFLHILPNFNGSARAENFSDFTLVLEYMSYFFLYPELRFDIL